MDRSSLQRCTSPLAFVAAILPALVLMTGGGGSASEPDAWKYDQVLLKSGRRLSGLVVQETPTAIKFAGVVHDPGRPRSVIHESIALKDIQSIDKLPPREHEQLEARIRALDPSLQKTRIKKLQLQAAAWEGSKAGAWTYTSGYFVLLSNARADVVRKSAVHLEQIYAAYQAHLPPRVADNKPTRIVIFRSREELQAHLRRNGVRLLNPAFFDPERNEILCACDLENLSIELEETKKQNQELVKKIDENEAALKRQFRGMLPKERREQFEMDRLTIAQTQRRNEDRYRLAEAKFYQMLYHEAFHAYLANFVYPPAEYEIPRWLNEGMAQIFEGAIINADELLIMRPDSRRLAEAKKIELVPLDELLRAEAGRYLAFHDAGRIDSGRHYLTSWALAYYLMFELK